MIQFHNPEYFIVAVTLAFVLLFLELFLGFLKNRRLVKWANKERFDSLLVRYGKRKMSNISRLLFYLSLVCLCLAIGRPGFGTEETQIPFLTKDIVFVLDTSLSMKAEDEPGGRLERAKVEILKILSLLPRYRIGLVAFSGAAVTVCPLTRDHASFAEFLRSLDTQTIGIPGTKLGHALEEAMRTLEDTPKEDGIIVLVTDGEDQEKKPDPLVTAQKIKENGFYLTVVAVGTGDPTPILLKDKQGNIYKKRDPNGSFVFTRLDLELLEEIAQSAGGKLLLARPGYGEMEEAFSSFVKEGLKGGSKRSVARLKERYALPTILAFILLSLTFLLTLGPLRQAWPRLRRK